MEVELTLPFIDSILCLPTAMTRFPNSTVMGLGFGAFVDAMNACRASPMPAANMFEELTRPWIDSGLALPVESLRDNPTRGFGV